MITFTTRTGRVFELLGAVPHERLDGSMTELLIWESACLDCGRPFQVKTSKGGRHGSRAFETARCERHRRHGPRAQA